MISSLPPMSNYERQRRFRERNPGYYGRLRRRRKAELTAALSATAAPPLALPAPTRLLLPAPVEQLPAFVIPQRQPQYETVRPLTTETTAA